MNLVVKVFKEIYLIKCTICNLNWIIIINQDRILLSLGCKFMVIHSSLLNKIISIILGIFYSLYIMFGINFPFKDLFWMELNTIERILLSFYSCNIFNSLITFSSCTKIVEIMKFFVGMPSFHTYSPIMTEEL